MLIPLGTDQPLRKTAWCTYGLIAINFFCHFFLTQTVPDYSLIPLGYDTSHIDPQFMPMTTVPHESMPLVRSGLVWYQFITFQFANTSLLILIGNMIFLFGLGRALENKIGHVGFLAIYLLGGAFAGLCHITATIYPVSGAAGSVCAVAAAFVVIMPNSIVRVLYFIYMIGVIEFSGLTFVLAYIGFDLLFTFSSIRSSQGAFSVVYITHVAGYAFGLAAGFLLLLTGLVPKSHNDLIHMIRQYRRRQAFSEQVRTSGQPWLNPVGGKAQIGKVMAGVGEPLSPRQEEILKLRAQVLEHLGATRFDAAAGLYDKLIALDPAQTLTRQAQFDLANHLFSAGQHGRAAIAYERFLETYKSDPDGQQVKLALAIIYTRYTRQPQKAHALLDGMAGGFLGADQKALIKTLRDELAGL